MAEPTRQPPPPPPVTGGESRALLEIIEDAQQWERAGQFAQARRRYQRALALVQDQDARRAADLTRWIGRTFMNEGDLESAMVSGQRSLDIASASGDSLAEAYALNFLGTVCQQRTALEAAESYYQRAEVVAADPGLSAMIQLNRGIIANIRGELHQALGHYQQSLVGLKEARHHDLVISALNNLGMVLTDLERWEEAAAAYAEALSFCELTGNTGVQVVVEVNRAEMLVGQTAFDEAEAACQSAFRLMRSIGDLRAAGDMFKLQGIIARELDDHPGAESHFARATRHAEERGDLLLAAEVAREQAVLFWHQKRGRETLVSLNQAHRLFEQLRARRELADVDRKMADLESTFVEIVRLWGESIESSDRYTQGHCVRVARYACALARAAGMDEQTLFWFNLGALLHDVGKIMIPAEVLNKPGGFTPQERILMERHPDAGVELLEGIEFPWDIRPMVRFHHERWGGGGYPTGIAGEEIPLSARVLAIADVFDALATDRPYRKAFPVVRCLEIMRDEMPRFFDPHLLSLWEGLLERGEVGVDARTEEARVGASEPDVAAATPPVRLLYAGPGILEVPEAGRAMWCVRCERSEVEARLAKDTFDVVALEMGEADAECLNRIRRIQAEQPEVAIVVVGPARPESLSLRAIQAGAHEYLTHGLRSTGELERAARQAVERLGVQQELSSRSMFDELTGLYNRRGFFTIARQHMKLAQRTGHEVFLVFADVDCMKQINDSFGHREGDRALRDFALLLQQCFRKSDVIARIGGDEFVALVLETSAAAVPFVTRRLEDQLRSDPLGERPYAFSVSLGVAHFDPAAPLSLESLLETADQAMYAEKRRRRQAAESPESSVVVV